jgi:NAD(P)-dependent dehydrogenase (short-subunit alcohol dehydrogenase family)
MGSASAFAGKVAAVTGGASGIGGAVARLLAARGASVLIVDINEAAARANAVRIVDAGGVAEVAVDDVGSEGAASRMVQHAIRSWGRLDCLVNNAWSPAEPDRGVLDLPGSAFDHAMNVMVNAAYLATQAAAPHMAAAGGGSVVNISSVHGFLAAPGRLAYDTAKAALLHMTRQMAVDLGPLGIRVNAVCPGHIVTERTEQRWARNPGYLEFFKQQYPVRRVGTPEDIARAVEYLCSDGASFVTGHALVVDGGLTVQLQEDISVRVAQWYRDHPETRLPD